MDRMDNRQALTDLDATLCIEKHVIRLDISMNDALEMQMPKALASLKPGHTKLDHRC